MKRIVLDSSDIPVSLVEYDENFGVLAADGVKLFIVRHRDDKWCLVQKSLIARTPCTGTFQEALRFWLACGYHIYQFDSFDDLMRWVSK